MVNISELLYLYKQGSEFNAYSHFGAHPAKQEGKDGVLFSVYAPGAKRVCLIGDFNGWDEENTMTCDQGIWHQFSVDAKTGQLYKFLIEGKDGSRVFHSDPYGFSAELRPHSANYICDPFIYPFTDQSWMAARETTNSHEAPMNIYEVQLCSWDTALTDDGPMDLRATADKLVEYCLSMHYTHIELMPITEYPLDDSWGYQTIGYFCLSGRYGKPDDMQHLVNLCHQKGIGVILDWVPGHFCPDEHGLANFDGTPLYGEFLHPHWGTYKFKFDDRAVWSFLLSSAVFWAKVYHIDGIRVDAVSSMLYLNYGLDTKHIRNHHGGEDDLSAKAFLQKFNDVMHENFPGFLTFAEEATSYQGVTAPTSIQGLGFDYKWNMGWMNDTLDYFEVDYDYRRENHGKITFGSVYMRDENFVLPFSHDEVVHGKKQMLDKMPGEYWRKFACLRTLMAYQMTYPGKKLNFMGIDFAQIMEWRFYEPLEWFMLKYPIHDSFHEYVRMLNKTYLDEPALFEMDNDTFGFEWIDGDNRDQEVFSYLRRAHDGSEIIVILNMSIYEYSGFRLGVQNPGVYTELFSSNIERYDGTGTHNENPIQTENIGCHRRAQSVVITVPPLSATAFKRISDSAL